MNSGWLSRTLRHLQDVNNMLDGRARVTHGTAQVSGGPSVQELNPKKDIYSRSSGQRGERKLGPWKGGSLHVMSQARVPAWIQGPVGLRLAARASRANSVSEIGKSI